MRWRILLNQEYKYTHFASQNGSPPSLKLQTDAVTWFTAESSSREMKNLLADIEKNSINW
jgi:hypothetical protein